LGQREISKRLKFSRGAIQTIIKRSGESGSYINRPKCGRNQKTTVHEDRILVAMSQKERTKSSLAISGELENEFIVKISSRTVRRCVLEVGLRGCKARKKPLLAAANVKKRLKWAKKYENWTIDDWSKIIWSDETNIGVIFVII
jgi:transposase